MHTYSMLTYSKVREQARGRGLMEERSEEEMRAEEGRERKYQGTRGEVEVM